ncbi:CubicO group peptidase (beta-lactamase class C family) [Bacillus pakistanensis]|uniref:CubicO group peptidase (Beta-lactamase class C family) n=1 Tax=Rossellomorea pakistanensis TaxID=992288 RepID=A0ABS2N7T9_9BACI|nr:serine hydrolase domain-containing protein [Bacillus pakistanensis]MBM7583921.1 CubicO group peptidase (beta-lactamase class C family) [Bacillus pakistanensis]
MFLTNKPNHNFSSVLNHVNNTYNQVICSGASVIVIHNDSIVLEEYIGKQSNKNDARIVKADTQFHVASVRKSYIGFAVAYAVYYGYIENIDDPVLKYLPEFDQTSWKDTTIRHLLTHTHGLHQKEKTVFREYPAGQNWTYRQVGIDALTQIVKKTTSKTVSDIIHELVFNPLCFYESNWYAHKHEKLVDVILRYNGDGDWKTSDSTEGDKMNMYVSTRELAYWGYLHLKQGKIDGKQIVPKEIIQLATSVQSPTAIDQDLPQNGFLWFVKDLPAKKSEIGAGVPKGSYQILGYTGVTLLVIPQENLVAVRMFNSFGSPEGYDYLSDVRSFGDTVMNCVQNISIEV